MNAKLQVLPLRSGRFGIGSYQGSWGYGKWVLVSNVSYRTLDAARKACTAMKEGK